MLESEPWLSREVSPVLAPILPRIKVWPAFLIHLHVHLQTKCTKQSRSKSYFLFGEHWTFLPPPISPELLSLPITLPRANTHTGVCPVPP